MAGKKKAENFMKEITNEKEWDSLCEYQGGLTVVDIYSEWAGPCTAMSGALKKIKLEVGDDSLIYAMAKSDTIPQLKMFRGHCKPTYLFIASGDPVAVMHGANAPLMKTMVSEQMDIERKVLAGEQNRTVIKLEDAVPPSELEAEEKNSKEDKKKDSEENQEENESGTNDGETEETDNSNQDSEIKEEAENAQNDEEDNNDLQKENKNDQNNNDVATEE